MRKLWQDAKNHISETHFPHPFALQYLGLRTTVGAIGVLLPWILVFGNQWVFDSQRIESSLSAYYYTGMRDVFVGALCAIAVFMASYRGRDLIDNWAANLACLFALLVAWFPTTPDDKTLAPKWIGQAHYTSAAFLFITLAIFCIFLLGKTDSPAAKGTPKKKARDAIHISCGVVILICILAASIAGGLPDDSHIHSYDPILWAEAIAISAFGLSWFVAGKAFRILKDPWEYGSSPPDPWQNCTGAPRNAAHSNASGLTPPR